MMDELLKIKTLFHRNFQTFVKAKSVVNVKVDGYTEELCCDVKIEDL